MSGNAPSTSCPHRLCGPTNVTDQPGSDLVGAGVGDVEYGSVPGQDTSLHNDRPTSVDAAVNLLAEMPVSGAGGVNGVYEKHNDGMPGMDGSSMQNYSVHGVTWYNHSLHNSALYNSVYKDSVYNSSMYNASDNATEVGESLVLSPEAKLGLILLYTLTTILAIGGNVLVVLVFTRGRRSRTDIRPFLINLAVADLIMAIFCMPFTFTFVMLKTWVFSKPMCPVVLFMQHLSVSASVFTNMAIGSDRFLVVMFPFRSRATNVRSRYVIIIIWVCAVALSSVQLAVGRATEWPDGAGGVVVTCDEVWSSQGARRIFTLFVLFITYIIPLVILAVAYSIVGILLWTRTTPGNAHEGRDLQQLHAKRKVVKMLVLVVVMFGVCWLPLHTFFLVIDFNPELMKYKSTDEERFFTALYYSVHWLAMSNSFVNPIIYSFSNDSFRIDLACLLYVGFPFCKCLKKIADRRLTLSTAETNIRNRMSTVRRYTPRDTMRATHPPHKHNLLRNGNRAYFDLKRGSSDKVERTRLCDRWRNGAHTTGRRARRGQVDRDDGDRTDKDRFGNHREAGESRVDIRREENDTVDKAKLCDCEGSNINPLAPVATDTVNSTGDCVHKRVKTEKARPYERYVSMGTEEARLLERDELDRLLEHDVSQDTEQTRIFESDSTGEVRLYQYEGTGNGKHYEDDQADRTETTRFLDSEEADNVELCHLQNDSSKDVDESRTNTHSLSCSVLSGVHTPESTDQLRVCGAEHSSNATEPLLFHRSDRASRDRLHKPDDKENGTFYRHIESEKPERTNVSVWEKNGREVARKGNGGTLANHRDVHWTVVSKRRHANGNAAKTETTSLCEITFERPGARDLSQICRHSSLENCVQGTGV